MKKLKDKSGFTLSELMMVVLIMGIIVAVALPSFAAIMKGMRVKEAKTQIRTLAVQVENFYNSSDATMHGFNNEQQVIIGINSNGKLHSLITHRAWLCGSYNPTTDKWEDAYVETDAAASSYNYNGAECADAGEFFIRYAYDYGPEVPSSEVKFPEDEDGYQVYIEFNPQLPEDDFMDTYNSGNYSSDLENSYNTDVSTRRPVGVITIKSTNPAITEDDYFEIVIR